MTKPATPSGCDADATAQQVREFAAALLAAGAAPAVVSRALALVGAELGLRLSNAHAAVLAAVLRAIVAAVSAHERATASTEDVERSVRSVGALH